MQGPLILFEGADLRLHGEDPAVTDELLEECPRLILHRSPQAAEIAQATARDICKLVA